MSGNSGERLFRRIDERVEHFQPRIKANPFSSLVENLCEVQRIPVDPLKRPDGPVRICLVSMPKLGKGDFTFEPFTHVKQQPRLVDDEACIRRLAKLNPDIERQYLTTYKEAVAAAVQDMRAHIVCVSELGLPHRAIVPLAQAQNFARDLAISHNVLIVAGTSHDKRTLYNTGYIYHPGGDGWTFHKTLSAAGMGELVSSPAQRRVLMIKTFGLRIAVMICLDIADYATLASVVRVKDKVDLVLVPCYTFKFDKMLEVAKIASKALTGIVAMVNAHVPNSTCHIARFGEDDEPKETKSFSSGATLSLFEVDQETFESERQRREKTRDNREVDWLFGSGDIPHVLSDPPVPRQRGGHGKRSTRR